LLFTAVKLIYLPKQSNQIESDSMALTRIFTLKERK